MATATNRLQQSKALSITSVLRQDMDVWVKNNLPKSRGEAGDLLINMKEPEGESFVVEIAPGKATNLSVQASDKAIQTCTELRRLIHQGDILVLTAEQVENLTDAEIYKPGDYLKNPHIVRDPKPHPNEINQDDVHPRLAGMAREYEMLTESLGEGATENDIEEVQVSRFMDELLGLSDLLTQRDFDYIRQSLSHPTIIKWMDRYLETNTPRGG